eukprot:8911607-Pyramimonas_sp.AAC.1
MASTTMGAAGPEGNGSFRQQILPSAFHHSQSAYSQTSEKHMPALLSFIVDPPWGIQAICE